MPSIKITSVQQKLFAAAIAIVTWFAIILQFFLSTGSAINFFSFFTIESNLLVAITLSSCLLFPSSTIGKFFSSISVQSAIALYIFIVALVYNTVLRGLFVLTGWNWMVDNLLHVVVPIIYVLYYLKYTPLKSLNWKDGLNWIYFPLAYLIYSLIRGSLVGWYPYPFLNVTVLGYPKVILNVVVMIAAFFIAGLLLIAYNKFNKSQKSM